MATLNYRTASGVFKEVSEGGWQDPARDLAERLTDSLVHRLRLSLEQRRWLTIYVIQPRRLLAGNRRPGFFLKQTGIRTSKAYPLLCCHRHRWQSSDREFNGTKFGHAGLRAVDFIRLMKSLHQVSGSSIGAAWLRWQIRLVIGGWRI